MIDQTVQFVARKYAAAYLNVYDAQLTPPDLMHMNRLCDFLKTHHQIVYFLGLPILPQEKKKQTLRELAQRFDLGGKLDRLLHLLLQDKRVFLLEPILKLIVQFYRRKHAILEFSITSYPRITDAELDELKQFLARSTGCAIIYTNNEDKNLIAGIRMESTTYLWEFSIAQQLRTLRTQTMR